MNERVLAIVAGTVAWSSRAKTADFGRCEYSMEELSLGACPGDAQMGNPGSQKGSNHENSVPLRASRTYSRRFRGCFTLGEWCK